MYRFKSSFYTYVYSCIYISNDAYIHIQIHSFLCTYADMYTYIFLCAYLNTPFHPHTHTQTHKFGGHAKSCAVRRKGHRRLGIIINLVIARHNHQRQLRKRLFHQSAPCVPSISITIRVRHVADNNACSHRRVGLPSVLYGARRSV